jgi:hypothetical protein
MQTSTAPTNQKLNNINSKVHAPLAENDIESVVRGGRNQACACQHAGGNHPKPPMLLSLSDAISHSK